MIAARRGRSQRPAQYRDCRRRRMAEWPSLIAPEAAAERAAVVFDLSEALRLKRINVPSLERRYTEEVAPTWHGATVKEMTHYRDAVFRTLHWRAQSVK